MRNTKWYVPIALIEIVISFAQPGHAQAIRAWLSSVDEDANSYSRTAPRKTFAGAISKTLAGGEISELNPVGFGTVTINKSINSARDGAGEACALSSSTNDIRFLAGRTLHL
ncbi:hypothetical protein [Tardiphaga sp. vice278]|uniref:hypothetical protein n=1 Tax=Tardiphaga sp. vice278 TaxID=2592815 RepID=UPI001162BDD6|nr:hypothetical protein [Tardiphaga sp. vice278]QDM17981.1 hypothetical protein FNL53_20015 [Tardiphaga sp. vice278]